MHAPYTVPSTTTDANLDCAFVENALFLHQSLIVTGQKNRIEVVTNPGCAQGALKGRPQRDRKEPQRCNPGNEVHLTIFES